MKRNQEYIKALDSNKKHELEELLKKEGSKSKFRAKIQMTFVYILASAIMFISLLVTDYLISYNNHLFYLPLIICTIISILLYGIYFWRWLKDYNNIKEYVQAHWFKLYLWVLSLTLVAFLISFLCTLIPVVDRNTSYIEMSSQVYLYNAILVGAIFDILLTIIAVSLDTYIIYHLEIDLQKLVVEYEENQVDYLKQKIQEEAKKIKENENFDLNNDISIDSSQNEEVQRSLSQEEIDNLLKQNSLFTDFEEKNKEKEENGKSNKN